ncbi:MAG TPA: TolC family protein [Opitutaceae bacterium]|nr:TolC family protein [Opitutaceae bacterium]
MLATAMLVLAAGCVSAPSVSETHARREVAAIGAKLGTAREATAHRHAEPASLPPLPGPGSPESAYVEFALYHHPAVRAAYDDWRASVESIAPTRALPDPQFTFQADIADTLMSFMPGLMTDLMGAGKREVMAREATAASTVAYRGYVAQVVKTAGAVRKAWVELAYAAATNELYLTTVRTADQAVALAGADYATGRGMPNFEQQVQFQNLLAQHHAHHAGVADRLVAARARFKSALGLLPTDPDPPWPDARLAATPVPPEAEIWHRVLVTNPDLARMRSMVDMAVTDVDVARKAATPDATVGMMVDLKQNPLMFRPTATVTLPVWREKIRANIAAAEARRDAAAERVTAGELEMAAELAQMLSMVRESDAMLGYIDGAALPNLDHSLASAEAAVQSGMASPTSIAELQLMAIDLRHDRLDMLRDRENAAVDLATMMAGVVPAHAPLVSENR